MLCNVSFQSSGTFKNLEFCKRILRFNSMSERRYLKILQSKLGHFKIIPIKFRNAEFAW